MWQPSERYPDPAVEILDPSFAKYRVTLAAVERLATGFRWCEGPAWFGDGRYLLWSDIPNNRIMKWDEETGAVSVFRKPSNNANGNTRDRQGRLVTCEHDARRVTRTEYDGSITVILDNFEGKHLNSPNDIVVKSDDSIWFSDPPFGILGNYEGHVAEPELPTNVYRVDGRTGEADRRHERDQPAQRPVLLARRKPDVHRRVGRDAAPHPCLRRRRDGTRLANRRVFVNAGPEGSPTAFAATSTAICGPAGAWARGSTGS